MFLKGRDKVSTATLMPPGDNKNRTLSIISANLRINGNVVTDGVIQLDGIVDGDVVCDDLTLGESAVINGSIQGSSIRISGTVNGEIAARSVEITRTAKVTGDISHTSLMIEAGAFVQGLCRYVETNDPKEGPKLTKSHKPSIVTTEKDQSESKPPSARTGNKSTASSASDKEQQDSKSSASKNSSGKTGTTGKKS
tara:strand:+ start:1053 stop:1640 length:588 start_codon:yes stop_codon:yes gene_type:complete